MVATSIAQLKTVVAATDLPHVYILKLPRASEEPVVAVQGASAELALERPTMMALSRKPGCRSIEKRDGGKAELSLRWPVRRLEHPLQRVVVRLLGLGVE